MSSSSSTQIRRGKSRRTHTDIYTLDSTTVNPAVCVCHCTDDLVLDSRAREAVDRVADDYWQKRDQQSDQDALKGCMFHSMHHF